MRGRRGRPSRPCRPRGAQRGLALIVVLWAGALMTLLSASFAFSLRTEARLASNLASRAAAAAAAEAGIVRLQAALLAVPVRERGALRGRMRFAGLDVDLAALPENSRIDINAAPPALIRSLMRHVIERDGLDASAEAVTDALLDWRDADDQRRPEGAETRDYDEATGVRPRNGAFLRVSELAAVRGVTPALYRALAPLITVHAASPQVDALNASRDVLLALPEVTEAQVDAFLASRGEEGAADLTQLASAGRYLARSGASTYSLMARGRVEGGVQATRRLVVRFTGNRDEPVTVLAWFPQARRADVFDATAAPADAGAEQR